MTDPRYRQKGFTKQLAHVVEECGEFLAAAGKTQRWGLQSVDPTGGAKKVFNEHGAQVKETNEQWLRRELADLIETSIRLAATMDGGGSADVVVPRGLLALVVDAAEDGKSHGPAVERVRRMLK